MKTIILTIMLLTSSICLYGQEKKNLVYMVTRNTELGVKNIYIDKSRFELIDKRLLKYVLVHIHTEDKTGIVETTRSVDAINLEESRKTDSVEANYTDKIIAIYKSTLKRKK